MRDAGFFFQHFRFHLEPKAPHRFERFEPLERLERAAVVGERSGRTIGTADRRELRPVLKCLELMFRLFG